MRGRGRPCINGLCSCTQCRGQFTLENTLVLRVGTGIFRLITTVSVVLIAVGALEFGLAVDQDHLDDAITVQRVGYIFMIAGLGGVMGIAGCCAFNVKQILKYRRRVSRRLLESTLSSPRLAFVLTWILI